MRLRLPQELQAEIVRRALAAFPKECCGLIEGERDADGFGASALHPARNLAEAPDRFEMDPKDLFAAARAARGRGQALIGCYHSHPNGQASPSRHDIAGAENLPEDFIWVIAATDSGACRLAGFVYRAPDFEPVGLSMAIGADLVTSSLNERS